MTTCTHVLQRQAFSSDLASGSHPWYSMVYADDAVLLPWSASGLQLLLDGMDHFCLDLGLIISPTKTEVVVFNGLGTASTWQV